MFRASTRLREVRVSALNARVLVAVAELLGEAKVAVVVVLFCFRSALGAVGIVLRNLSHGKPPMTDH